MATEKIQSGDGSEGSPLSSPLRYAQDLEARASLFGLSALGDATTLLVARYLLVVGKKDHCWHLSVCWPYKSEFVSLLPYT